MPTNAHPARYGAFGMAVQEAVCRGLPVIVSLSCPPPPGYPNCILRNSRAWSWRTRRTRASWPTVYGPGGGIWKPGLPGHGLAVTMRSYTWVDMAAEFVAAFSEGDR